MNRQLIRLVILPLALPLVAASIPPAPSPPSPQVEYMIVVTGTELLEGVYPDAHTHFLTRTLRPLGLRCVGSMSVDDRPEDLTEALRFAARAPLILVTGGLGPTPNDITRETIADFSGIPLREHSEVLAAMERRFKQTKDQLPANLRRQALVPGLGSYLPNARGTAVGLVFDRPDTTIVALPGPPRELQPMVEQELVPLLQRRYGLHRLGISRTLRFVGLGQSQISQTLQDHVELPPDLVITSQFDAGRVDFTFTLPGHTNAEEKQLDQISAILRRELGTHLYAEDGSSLEEVMVRLLDQRGLTLAIVEIGSGGHVTDSLTHVEHLAQVLVGSYVAPSEERILQLLQMTASESIPSRVDQLKALAQRARSCSGSQAALAVGFPEADDGAERGVSVTWVGSGAEAFTRHFPLRDASAEARALLTTQVLDWLRRQLE